MKRKRHTEEQIIAILKEHEARMKTADLCRKHGISEGCFYNWKANEEWRADYNTERSHSRLGWMSPSTYAAARRSAALRYTDGSAQRTAATTAHLGNTDTRLQFQVDKKRGQRQARA